MAIQITATQTEEGIIFTAVLSDGKVYAQGVAKDVDLQRAADYARRSLENRQFLIDQMEEVCSPVKTIDAMPTPIALP